jgi:aminoglycoside phosphotransferase (APT) family kinase protein
VRNELERVTAWLEEAGAPVRGPLTMRLIAGGLSNLTYALTDAAGSRWVLRRPPHSALPSAHNVAREARIMAALAGSSVPVPHVVGIETDSEVLGAAFFVMDFVDGSVVATHEDGPGLSVGARGVASADLVDVLAAVHTVNVDAVGLGDLGPRADYLPRQLRRWQRQFAASTRREVPLIEEIHGYLVTHQPPQRRTGLVHGDFRMGNVLVDPQGSVRAVLDWELAALGDTMADLGWLLATWREDGEPELYPSPSGHPGFLSRAEMASRYAAATGADVSDLPYYVAFSLWRLACIHEGIYARYSSGAMGTDHDVDVEGEARKVIVLAEAAREAYSA